MLDSMVAGEGLLSVRRQSWCTAVGAIYMTEITTYVIDNT